MFYNVIDHGVICNSVLDTTDPLQALIDKVSAGGGGTILFPAGNYLISTIILRSHLCIHLDPGALILGQTDVSLYPKLKPELKSHTDHQVCRSLFYAEREENITIEGQGTINFQGDHENFQTDENDDPGRPYGFRFIECKKVNVQGVFLTNSAQWLHHYLACEDVTIQNLRVYNHANRNNDGLDIDGCKNVLISNCHIDSDDDAICLKSTSHHACENIVITNCIASSHANAIKIGTESSGGFKNITISNCQVKFSASGFEHINGISTCRSGLALMVVDGGYMENIMVNGIIMDTVMTPIYIRLADRGRIPYDSAPPTLMGRLKNVFIQNITATNIGKIPSNITAIDGYYLDTVKLHNIFVQTNGGGTSEDISAPVPEDVKGYPNPDRLGNLPSHGFYIRHARNIELKNIEIVNTGKEERPALALEDIDNICIENVNYTRKGDNSEEMIMSNIRNCNLISEADQALRSH